MPRWTTFALLFGLFVDAACSGADSPALPSGPIPGASTWQLISPDGGTIATADDVTLTIPPGALTEPTFIGVTRSLMTIYSPVAAFGANPSGWHDSYSIDALGPGYEIDPANTTFMVPVTITLPVPATSGTDTVVCNYQTRGAPFPSTLVDPTHVSGQTSNAGIVFAGVVTQFEQGCAMDADCATGHCRGNYCTAN
jgi:hypothetical protein